MGFYAKQHKNGEIVRYNTWLDVQNFHKTWY